MGDEAGAKRLRKRVAVTSGDPAEPMVQWLHEHPNEFIYYLALRLFMVAARQVDSEAPELVEIHLRWEELAVAGESACFLVSPRRGRDGSMSLGVRMTVVESDEQRLSHAPLRKSDGAPN